MSTEPNTAPAPQGNESQPVQPPVAPDPQVAAPAAPPPTEPPTPQMAARQELYKKYYGEGEAQPPAGEPPTGEPPAAPPPAAPDPNQLLMEQIQAMNAQIAALKEQLQPTPPPPPTPPPTPPDPNMKAYKDWIDALIQGDAEGAQRLIREQTEAIVKERERSVVDGAVQMVRAEDEIRRFTEEVRAKNADLMPMERQISLAVDARMAEHQTSGTIKDLQSYTETFKQVLTEEVEEARKILQQWRAAGKDDASVLQREVLNSTPMTPTPPSAPPGTPAPNMRAPESGQDYLKRRMAQGMARRGLA